MHPSGFVCLCSQQSSIWQQCCGVRLVMVIWYVLLMYHISPMMFWGACHERLQHDSHGILRCCLSHTRCNDVTEGSCWIYGLSCVSFFSLSAWSLQPQEWTKQSQQQRLCRHQSEILRRPMRWGVCVCKSTLASNPGAQVYLISWWRRERGREERAVALDSILLLYSRAYYFVPAYNRSSSCVTGRCQVSATLTYSTYRSSESFWYNQ